MPNAEVQQDLRNAVRDLCKAFPDSYWRELDADARVSRRVRQGADRRRLSRRADSGGIRRLGPRHRRRRRSSSRRSTAAARNAGACHAQMYTMGTLLRHGSDAQKREYLPKIADRRAAAAGVRRQRADDRLRHDAAEDDGRRARATATSSAARRSGSRAPSTRICCCSSSGRRRSSRSRSGPMGCRSCSSICARRSATA